jgi:hypothetical protein
MKSDHQESTPQHIHHRTPPNERIYPNGRCEALTNNKDSWGNYIQCSNSCIPGKRYCDLSSHREYSNIGEDSTSLFILFGAMVSVFAIIVLNK